MSLRSGMSTQSPSGWTVTTLEMAEFLGLMAADGYVSEKGHRSLHTTTILC